MIQYDVQILKRPRFNILDIRIRYKVGSGSDKKTTGSRSSALGFPFYWVYFSSCYSEEDLLQSKELMWKYYYVSTQTYRTNV